jgi:hypothetical protein
MSGKATYQDLRRHSAEAIGERWIISRMVNVSLAEARGKQPAQSPVAHWNVRRIAKPSGVLAESLDQHDVCFTMVDPGEEQGSAVA